jgi:hypothetical protein
MLLRELSIHINKKLLLCFDWELFVIRAATPRISATASPTAVKVVRLLACRNQPETEVYSEPKPPAMTCSKLPRFLATTVGARIPPV